MSYSNPDIKVRLYQRDRTSTVYTARIISSHKNSKGKTFYNVRVGFARFDTKDKTPKVRFVWTPDLIQFLKGHHSCQ